MNKLEKAYADTVKDAFDYLMGSIRAINTANGWRSIETTKGERIALIHSEASELLEWVRKGTDVASDHINASGEAEELADMIIRCLDYADIYGIDIAGVTMKKLQYNAKRGYRHGGKLL